MAKTEALVEKNTKKSQENNNEEEKKPGHPFLKLSEI